MTQTNLNLEGDSLSSRNHIIQVVQYEDNDVNKEVLTYKEVFYNIEIIQ